MYIFGRVSALIIARNLYLSMRNSNVACKLNGVPNDDALCNLSNGQHPASISLVKFHEEVVVSRRRVGDDFMHCSLHWTEYETETLDELAKIHYKKLV